jgi:ABC-type antimicrobial peptide transport system permease subunit
MAQGQSSWKGEPATNVEIEVSIALLAKALAADPDFIRLISNKVRKELTKDVRTMGNLFGKWAGR